MRTRVSDSCHIRGYLFTFFNNHSHKKRSLMISPDNCHLENEIIFVWKRKKREWDSAEARATKKLNLMGKSFFHALLISRDINAISIVFLSLAYNTQSSNKLKIFHLKKFQKSQQREIFIQQIASRSSYKTLNKCLLPLLINFVHISSEYNKNVNENFSHAYYLTFSSLIGIFRKLFHWKFLEFT